MSVLGCGSGLANKSDRSPDGDICNYTGTPQVSELSHRKCVSAWGLLSPKTLMRIPLFLVLVAYTFKHINMKAKEKPT